MMMMSGDSEMQQRDQALKDEILRAAQAGIPPDAVAKLRHLALGHYKEGSRRRLTGEPTTHVGPMRLV